MVTPGLNKMKPSLRGTALDRRGVTKQSRDPKTGFKNDQIASRLPTKPSFQLPMTVARGTPSVSLFVVGYSLFERALEKYLNQLRTDTALRAIAIERYKKVGILELVDLRER